MMFPKMTGRITALAAVAALSTLIAGCGGMSDSSILQNPAPLNTSGMRDDVTRINDGTSNTRRSPSLEMTDGTSSAR